MAKPDYLKKVGAQALGGRLRRLSERIDGETAELYRDYGIEFEQRWFGIVNQLMLHGDLSVTDIAERLGITHASVSQARHSLERAGFVEGFRDEADARRRVLRLTSKGQALTESLASYWRASERAAEKIAAEVPGLMSALDGLEEALDRRSLKHRVIDEFDRS